MAAWLLDHVRYIWPSAVAGALACAEIKCQRQQDALEAQVKAEASSEELSPVSRTDSRGRSVVRTDHRGGHQPEARSGQERDDAPVTLGVNR